MCSLCVSSYVYVFVHVFVYVSTCAGVTYWNIGKGPHMDMHGHGTPATDNIFYCSISIVFPIEVTADVIMRCVFVVCVKTHFWMLGNLHLWTLQFIASCN